MGITPSIPDYGPECVSGIRFCPRIARAKRSSKAAVRVLRPARMRVRNGFRRVAVPTFVRCYASFLITSETGSDMLRRQIRGRRGTAPKSGCPEAWESTLRPEYGRTRQQRKDGVCGFSESCADSRTGRADFCDMDRARSPHASQKESRLDDTPP
jgi:hypothetical protein